MSLFSLLSLFTIAAAAAATSVTTTSFCLTGLASTPTSTVTTTTTTSTTTLSTVTVTSTVTPVTTIVPPSQTAIVWKTKTRTSTLNLAQVTDVYYTYTSTSTLTLTNLYTANFNTTVLQTSTVSNTNVVTVPTPSGFTALGDELVSRGYSYGNIPLATTTLNGVKRRNRAKRTAAPSTPSSYPQYVICDEIAQVLVTTTVRSTASTTKTVSKTPKTVTKTSTIVVTNTKTVTPTDASTTISTVTSSTLTTQSTVSLTSTATSTTTTTLFNPAATQFAICNSNNIVNSVSGQYDLFPYPDALQATLGSASGMLPEECCTLCALDPNCAVSWMIPGAPSVCTAFFNQNNVCNPPAPTYPYAGELYIWNSSYGYSGTYVSNNNCGMFNFDGAYS